MKKKTNDLNNLQLMRIRDDGSFYTTTVGERKSRDTKEKMKQVDRAQKASERARNKHLRKAKRAQWNQNYGERLKHLIQLIAILALIIIIGRLIWPLVVGLVIMMAVGSGMSDAGEQMNRQNEHNRNTQAYRDGKPPRYW